ncbi:predicted protein [Nematostella vectensis]|uniref:LicD/FKTN/FKRP nucleotidyltransferase domain-containing protein n=1 Tax=Nematostella vectensis TaxID=45351 RepID=A7SR44_NEMVE|nr:predicted protein [Nematostella vectensis]|eukprot:XP_001625931.1 predicted protein [Nematostella vectensis]
MAKFGNLFLSDELHKVDRGIQEGKFSFSDPALFGNDHGVLRIVQEDRIEWTDCVANGRICKEEPYNKTTPLLGLGMPICCSVVLDEILRDLVDVFHKKGISYLVLYGTLIGAVRSKTIIPWTNDVDIGLRNTDFNNPAFFASLQKDLGRKYLVGEFVGMPRMIPVFNPSTKLSASPYNSGFCEMQLKGKLFSDEVNKSIADMLPLKTSWYRTGYLDFYTTEENWWIGSSIAEINGMKLVTVKDPHGFLANHYGKDYMDPSVKNDSWKGIGQ